VWISEQRAIISLDSINFYKWCRECLLRGTSWVFKSYSYSFVLKGLIRRSEVKTARSNGCCLNTFMFIGNINTAYNWITEAIIYLVPVIHGTRLPFQAVITRPVIYFPFYGLLKRMFRAGMCRFCFAEFIRLMHVILKTDKLIPSVTIQFISPIKACYMFRSLWLSSGTKYMIFKTQIKFI
jgi:hypothetical protein